MDLETILKLVAVIFWGIAVVTSKEVTPDTVFIFEYYEYNDSIVSIKREN